MIVYVVEENYTGCFYGMFDNKSAARKCANENDGHVIEYNLGNYTLDEWGEINPMPKKGRH